MTILREFLMEHLSRNSILCRFQALIELTFLMESTIFFASFKKHESQGFSLGRQRAPVENQYFLISEPSLPTILPQSDPYLSRSLFIIIFYRSFCASCSAVKDVETRA